MRKIITKISFFLAILAAVLLFGKNILAYNFISDSGLNTTADKTGHTSQALFGSQGSIEFGLGVILDVVLSFLGVIFLVLIVYSGILWMTASGNEQKAEKAKDILRDSIIGLIVVAAAYAISYFVLGSFINFSLR